ncbi:MAG: hypothetical protein E6590_17445 [Clostridiales bacterium]|nr:hypothetical protein [Clostridiales bacterium]
MQYIIEINQDELIEIIYKYTDKELKSYEIIDSSRGKDDIRNIYCLTFKDDSKLVMKITNNFFTTPEKITGWGRLCNTYNSLGIYCPKIISTKESTYYIEGVSATGVNYILYVEEYKKYKTICEYIEDECKGNIEKEKTLELHFKEPVFWNKVLETIGIVAKQEQDLVSWRLINCLYDTFSEEDGVDENYRHAQIFCDFMRGLNISDKNLVSEIWKIYVEKRIKFENKYRSLPQAVFQGDLNESNILIDENLRFIGLIDFNLSGTEVVLNQALYECLYMLNKNELNKLNDKTFKKTCDNILMNRLDSIKKYYNFNLEEQESFINLYNIVAPFYPPNICLFINAIKEGNIQYVEPIIKWVYYQLTREDLTI